MGCQLECFEVVPVQEMITWTLDTCCIVDSIAAHHQPYQPNTPGVVDGSRFSGTLGGLLWEYHVPLVEILNVS